MKTEDEIKKGLVLNPEYLSEIMLQTNKANAKLLPEVLAERTKPFEPGNLIFLIHKNNWQRD